MAIVKRIASKAKVDRIITYLLNEEKTDETLVSGKDCSKDNIIVEFNLTQELYNKSKGVRYHHVIQSFSPNDDITPEKSHELAKELAEKEFKDFEVFIVTHKDKLHIHNHFVVNSVSFKTGLKYAASNKSLWDIKRTSNEICKREGYAVLDLDKRAHKRISEEEKKILDRGHISWKEELRSWIEICSSSTNNEEEIISMLENDFNVDVMITERNVTFKHPSNGMIVRGKRLGGGYMLNL